MKKYPSKYLQLKKHNPKLETYVETTKNIIIEQVNKWVVSTTGNMDIY